MQLKNALDNPLWKSHKPGDKYKMSDVNGKMTEGWRITYYPLFGTYKDEQWMDFTEPRALIEKPMTGGFDFREIPLRYLERL